MLHAQQLLHREFLGGRLRCLRTAGSPSVGARDEDEHGQEPHHDDREQRDDEFHVENATTGV